MFGDHLRNNLRHAQESFLLQALGCADDQRLRLQVCPHLLEKPAAVLRRHYAYYNFGRLQSFIETAGHSDTVGNRIAGKKKFVYPPGRDRISDFFFKRPKPDLVRSLAPEHDGEPGSPRAGANDRNAAHPRLH